MSNVTLARPLDDLELALWLRYTYSGISVSVACVIQSICGFGNAIVVHVMWLLLEIALLVPGDVIHLVLIIRMMNLVNTPMLAYMSRRRIDWFLVGQILPLMLLGNIVGTFLLVTAPSPILKTVLGGLLLAYASWRIVIDLQKQYAISCRQRCVCGRRARHQLLVNHHDDADSVADEPSSSCKHNELALSSRNSSVVNLAECEFFHEHEETEQEDKHHQDQEMVALIMPLENTQPAPRTLSQNIQMKARKAWRALSGFDLLPPPSKKIRAAAWIAGLASGLLGGLFGVAGPPLMVFFTLFPFDKDTVRGVTSWTGLIVMPFPTIYLFFIENKLNLPEFWPDYLITLAAAVMGTMLGNRLFKYTNTELVTRIILGLLFAASISLLGLPQIPTLCLISVIVGLFIGREIVTCASASWKVRHHEQSTLKDVAEQETGLEMTER